MNYTVKRSDRRTLCIEVTREGQVLIRAPRKMPVGDIERFTRQKEAWIRSALARQREYAITHPEPTEAELAQWKRQAEQILPPLTAELAAVMGVTVASVRINRAKTRFGSCGTGGRICFSCRLMAYPPQAIRYVVIHELAHIRHPNHGAGFWQEVEHYCPDFRACRALLRR